MEYRPGEQLVQFLDPDAVLYEPGAQLVQEPAPDADHWPTSHGVHADDCAGAYCPAEHVVQLPELAVLYVPAEHVAHGVVPPGLY